MKKLTIITLIAPALCAVVIAAAAVYTSKLNRTTTINSVIYFPADTALMVEFHSIDTDSAGVDWHSTRNEKIFLTDSTAAGELEDIGGSAQVIGEALRVSYGLIP